MIEKQIFTFWHSHELPLLNKICIDSWQKTNPNFRIHIITNENLHEYVECFPKNYERLIIQHKSDYIRMYLLYYYGGVWLDNTILMLDKLENIFDFSIHKLQAYRCYYNCNYLIENSILYSPKHNGFMKLWLMEFTKAIAIGLTTFYRLNYRKHKEIYNKYNQVYRVYLTNMITYRITEKRCSANNLHHVINKWVFSFSLHRLVNKNEENNNFRGEFIKMTSGDRERLLYFVGLGNKIENSQVLASSKIRLVEQDVSKSELEEFNNKADCWLKLYMNNVKNLIH